MAVLSPGPESKASVMRLARQLAAFYLGYPLFVPKNGTSYPSLFLWSQMEKNECPLGCLPLNRDELGRELPPEYVPRTPAVLFAHCGSVLEAILFSDHFSDIRSSLMMRILADQLFNLNLTTVFLEDLRTKQLQKQVDLIAADASASAASSEAGQRYVQSMLELEIFYETDDLRKMQLFILSQLEVLFAQLPLRVHDTSVLPRPPLYCYQSSGGNSLECRIHSTMHCYLQILFISLQKANRMNIEINRVHDLISGDATTVPCSLLAQALLLVLRTTYRDRFSLAAVQNLHLSCSSPSLQFSKFVPSSNDDDLPHLAAKYNALIAAADSNEGRSQLKSWLEMATTQDFEHVERFLEFVSENFPEKNDLPPLTCLTRPLWREAMSTKQKQQLKRTDWLSGIIVPAHKVSRLTYDKMAFVATEWTSPLALDTSLIPLLLRLLPSDFCSPSSAIADRSCVSARSPLPRSSTEQAERIFSPRVDVISMYAERGRKVIGKDSNGRAKSANELKIRALREQFKKNVSIQRNLQEDIDGERSFLESLPSSRFTDGTEITRPKFSSMFLKAEKPNKSNMSEYSNKGFTKDLQAISKKLDEIQSKLGQPAATIDNSSVSDSQQTEDPQEDGYYQSDRSNEELEPEPLNYEKTAPGQNPLPKMERLDFSLLSPTADVGKRKVVEKSFEKTPSRGTLAQPEWMRLIPLGETNSGRLPLLQHNFSAQKESKTERSTQTGIFRGELVERGCQTKEEERIPPDSGFLDTIDRSPLKKIEMIEPMSRQKIQELLSQM
ncbi:hypothetical protein Y032_0023g688 [Ancylostoma ceylanicum]|nr:hypothetical protein Y032_0023g688 [Ancylostoma ceylanicum]